MAAFSREQADEWLDADLGSSAEIESALCSLCWVNRLLGGNRMHRRLLRRAISQVPAGGELHVLEAAAGRADVLRAAIPHLGWPLDRLRITLLDRNDAHFPAADSEWVPGLPAPERVHADALDVPLPDESVDIVSNCLFLHHLSERQVTDYLREALRVARVAVVINDLERSGLHYRLAQLMRLVDPSRISRHDGPVSVRQSYTKRELAGFASGSHHRFELCRGYLFRVGLIVWK